MAITKIFKTINKAGKYMQKFENTLANFIWAEDTGYEINNLIEHFNTMIKKSNI